MIGQYRFFEAPPNDAVVVQLSRAGDHGCGSVHFPSQIRAAVADLNIQLLQKGEVVTVALALGFGVIIAGLSGRSLYLSGDDKAWPEQ